MKVAVLSGRALALAILGWSLVKVGVDRLFGAKTGLALFHDNYDADRLAPVDADERARLAGFSRCIACGRCDIGEGGRMARSRGEYPGLMAIVLGASRSMPDYDAAARALSHVSDDVLASKECPAEVPFLDLARFVRAKAAALVTVPPPAPDARLPADDSDDEGAPRSTRTPAPAPEPDRLRLPSHA